MPIEWWALTKIAVELHRDADHFQEAAVAHLREAAAAEFGRRRHAEDAELAEPVDDFARDVGFAIDALGIEMSSQKLFEIGDRLFDFGSLRQSGSCG